MSFDDASNAGERCYPEIPYDTAFTQRYVNMIFALGSLVTKQANILPPKVHLIEDEMCFEYVQLNLYRIVALLPWVLVSTNSVEGVVKMIR